MNDILYKAQQRHVAKLQRQEAITSAIVKTKSGRAFDANEPSQQRMHRAIDIMADNETMEWVLADNTKATVTRAELREALRLAFLKQSAMHINQTET